MAEPRKWSTGARCSEVCGFKASSCMPRMLRFRTFSSRGRSGSKILRFAQDFGARSDAAQTPQLAEKIFCLYTGNFPEQHALAPNKERGGCMGRCGSVLWVVILILLIGSLAGCGSSNNAPAAPNVPASITLTPATASVEVGGTQNYT